VTADNKTREHFEDSILLAYLRRQQLEDHLRLRISRHIDVEQCPRCRHKLNELAQVSTTLNVLGRMSSYQRYPELSVADTYARVQRAANKRTPLQAYLHRAGNQQRPRKSAVRLASLPAAFGLTLLFTIVMVFAIANLPGTSWNSRSFKSGTSSNQNIATVVESHHSTPPPDPALAATANARTSITPTISPVTGPYMEVCSTPADIAQWRLVICGHNFDPGDKVTLVALGKMFIWQPNLPVDKQGNFQVGWNIGTCGNLPTAIYAYEIETVHQKPFSVKLQDISFAGCSLPTPTAGVKPGV
jgi:hypothetical protein